MNSPARIVTETIQAPAHQVAAFVRQLDKLPLWASGLAAGIHQENGLWFADSPMGQVQVRMSPENPYGVLDHEVTMPNGQTVHNAFRVTPLGEGKGCLLCFVVLRQPGMSDAQLEADVAHVANDLRTLKGLLG